MAITRTSRAFGNLPIFQAGFMAEIYFGMFCNTAAVRPSKLVIRADLPGLSKDDVNVEVTDNAITISGERRNENEEKREGYYRSECSYGSFYRPLPEGVDSDDANATFNNGVLEIALNAPKLESRSRKLEISEGGEESQRSRAQKH